MLRYKERYAMDEIRIVNLRIFLLDSTDVPVSCKYVMCRATCQGYSDIPRNLSSQTTSM